MQTYSQIAENYKVDIKLVYRRVHLLKIKGRKDGREVKFTDTQINEILTYQPPTNSKTNDRRKIAIIEFYLRWGTGNKVSRFLNLHRNVVNSAIKEYKENGYITVESKMNKDERL